MPRLCVQIVEQAVVAAAQGPPLLPESKRRLRRLSCCFQQREAEWATFPCVPTPYLSNWMNGRMYDTVRAIADSCLRESAGRFDEEEKDLDCDQSGHSIS